MPLITEDLLFFDEYRSYAYQDINRARSLAYQKKVTVVSFEGELAVCMVEDKNGTFTVQVTSPLPDKLGLTCSCGQCREQHFCHHTLASIYALRPFVHNLAVNHWRYRLQTALASTPRQKSTKPSRQLNLALLGLQVASGLYSTDRIMIYPFKVSSTQNAAVRDYARLSPDEILEKLQADQAMPRYAALCSRVVERDSVVNLDAGGVYAFNSLVQSSRFFSGTQDISSTLLMAARLKVPLYWMGEHNELSQLLIVRDQTVMLEAAVAESKKGLKFEGGVEIDGVLFTTAKSDLVVLGNTGWVKAGKWLARVENPRALEVVSIFPLSIPGPEIPLFQKEYLNQVADLLPVKGGNIHTDDIKDVIPVPGLYLQEVNGVLGANLQFAYGEYKVPADPLAGPITQVSAPDSWQIVRIHRNQQEENRFIRLLTEPRFGLKRAAGTSASAYELRARTHPYDFLTGGIQQLTSAGFEIYGEENLKTARINRSVPSISLNLTSGIDWFDVNAVVNYGDQHVSFRELRQALKKHDTYIKLADGTIGQIPEEWLERYQRLFDLVEDTPGGMRVADYHLPLLDTLVEDAQEKQLSADFETRRQRLRSFESIQPHALPAGFNGELRPYQKAGYDWLHFLHDYHMGGCLADDMGLGKTIQMLAFLQSLVEEKTSTQPSLIVVPKSLIANWQREASRFTPGLRVLEYTGQGRKKDGETWSDYDLILTTYGIVLRDIEKLRQTQFHYAILDESQAIKNPLAQSSRAVRLLNAEHRLVMTGTPVENNTFDLWSQFAFINPGLLGNMEFFKRSFAVPIEGKQDGDAAETLRRLVYPFLLRRTKDQVAPELPPRTERIIYTDFDPSQRKLYNQTRDNYRGVILGMLEEQGVNDTRMKILEGLLRLRQLCIHPALVDANFDGTGAKFEIVLETLETLVTEGHKALVFSQFVQTLRLLRAELDARKLPYAYLDGHTQNRLDVVDRFQTDPSLPIFLISLKAGGVGLNLTSADYVIHLDPWWNPAVEMQAADRTHRIGQEKPVFIYKFITRQTVEEKILALQAHKKELVDQLVNAEGSFFKSITAEDVKMLFS